jgi:hypothetical protein
VSSERWPSAPSEEAIETTEHPRPRARPHGLLSRPPSTFRELDGAWSAMLIDPAAPIQALAELMDDGLLTREEFDRAKQRALRWSTAG